MKKSNYNIFVPYKNGLTIIYNSFSGAVALFNEEYMGKYESGDFTSDELSTLYEKGIYIDDDKDEWAIMEYDREVSCLHNKTMYLRVWTTTACNAQCEYCFEKGMPVMTMTLETAKKVVDYVKSHYHDGIEQIVLEWFGGEPLLNTEVIDYTFDNLRLFCEEKHCKFFNKLITNGSLIDGGIVDKFNKWNVKHLQITFDGNEWDYNHIKNYKNPDKYNFKSVFDNLRLIPDGIEVCIRMNYNGANYESLSELIRYLASFVKENNKHNFTGYVYPLWDSLVDCDGQYHSVSHADSNVVKLLDELVTNGLGDIRYISRLNYRKNLCHGASVDSVSILPNGDISKCCETFEKVIGNLDEGIVQKDVFMKACSVEVDEDCRICKQMPICQGGCRASKFVNMNRCHVFKDVIGDLLIWYVEKMFNK